MKNTIFMQQVHGNNVVVVSEKDIGSTISNCDAMITNDMDIKLVVQTADCLPIKIYSKNGHVHGVIHAGWRGLRKKIIASTVNLIKNKFKIFPNDLVVEIGPHICVKHYEVKDDVAKFFKELEIVGNKKFLDLGLIAKKQLLDLGVLQENIKIDKRCTFEDRTLYSHRRDKTTKRNITIF